MGLGLPGLLLRTGHGHHCFMIHLLASRPNKMCKFTVVVPTRDQWAPTVAQILVSEWFYKFGIPSCHLSDQGWSFESSLIHQLCLLYGVAKSHIILQVMVSANDLIGLSINFIHSLFPRNRIGPPVCHRCCSITTPSLTGAQMSLPLSHVWKGTSASSRLSPLRLCLRGTTSSRSADVFERQRCEGEPEDPGSVELCGLSGC